MSNFISLEKGIAINGIEYNLHLSSKKLKVGFDVRTLVCFDAKLDKIKSKNNEDPIKIFNTAITNVKPNLECRSRRVGGATYQVPVEVKAKRKHSQVMHCICLHHVFQNGLNK